MTATEQVSNKVPAQADNRITLKEFQEGLADKIKKLTESDGWKDFLKMSARMHKYSFSNRLWLYFQGMQAGITISRVASATTWKKLGRWPKAGSKSLRVLAPLIGNFDEKDEKGQATGDKVKRIYGFKLVPVFDISQTDGKELPDSGYEPLQNGFNQEVWDALVSFAGCPVKMEKLDDAEVGGYYSPLLKHIVINTSNTPAMQMAVLAHEIAHAHLDHKKSDRNTETIAEGVAYMVMTQLGLDVDGTAIPYIAGWTNGNVDMIKTHAKEIFDFGNIMLKHIYDNISTVDIVEEAAEEAKKDWEDKPKKPKKPAPKKKKTIKA